MNLRKISKRIIKLFFLLLLFPLYLLFLTLSLIGNRDGTFQSCSQLISLIPGKIGIYCRAAFYRMACPNTSDEISVGFLTILSHQDTTIQKGVYIGPQCNIGKCTIGKNTLLGSGVHILSGNRQHDFQDISTPIQNQTGHFEKITIGEDCWLGNTALIMASLGSQCIIAAGSIVTKEAENGAIMAGNPARLIRNRILDSAVLSSPQSQTTI
jgi:acetyltransferase-like isoleucine patch superfamily enzyme